MTYFDYLVLIVKVVGALVVCFSLLAVLIACWICSKD